MSIKDYLSTPVALTNVNGIEISTVKLGRLMSGGVYETCVFYKDGSSDVVAQYRTRLEAENGHRRWVKRLK